MLRKYKRKILFALIALINIVIFFKHITGTVSFPWDFSQAYFAIPNFWINTISNGYFPFWVPFQGMGYPLLMNLQSGIFYPPFYLFVILKIPYTLVCANIFQVVHIFFGAIGFFYLARKVVIDEFIAFILAVAFNLYGGFYSNSEHADIVRSLTFIPWILYCLPFSKGESLTLKSKILLPVLFLLMWTGGYPGVAVSATMCFFVYTSVYVLFDRINLKKYLSCVLYAFLGIGMAAISFLPALLLKEEITRSADITIEKTYFLSQHFLSLLHPIYYKSLPSDMSMRSVHIVFPVLFFLTYVTFQDVKRFLPLFTLGIFAYLMASGSYLYTLLCSIFKPLSYSRFPSSDYRTFFSIVLILYSGIGFSNFIKIKKYKSVISRMLFLVTIYLSTYIFLLEKKYFEKDLVAIALFVFTLLLCASILFKTNKINRILFVSVILILCFVDFYRLNFRKNNYFVDEKSVQLVKKEFGSLRNINPQLLNRLKGESSRPERSDKFWSHKLGYRGYLTGEYMIGDYSGPMQFKIQTDILNDSALKKFAKLKWTPIKNDSFTVFNFYDNDSIRSIISEHVQLKLYKPNEIVYEVQSDSAFSFVENETYFMGWKATISSSPNMTFTPSPNKGFRMWNMPSGKYIMTSKFEMPYFSVSIIISIIFFIIWIALLLVSRKIKN